MVRLYYKKAILRLTLNSTEFLICLIILIYSCHITNMTRVNSFLRYLFDIAFVSAFNNGNWSTNTGKRQLQRNDDFHLIWQHGFYSVTGVIFRSGLSLLQKVTSQAKIQVIFVINYSLVSKWTITGKILKAC